jgi:hypothetical protein
MIKIVDFPSKVLGDVAKHIRKLDKEYLFVDHFLEAEEKINEDVHKSNEWIIFPTGSGSCEITVEGESAVIELNEEVTKVVAIYAGKKHSLVAETNISYTVLRDGFD